MLLTALSEGGCAVDMNVKKRLLINPDNAEPDVYNNRVKLAPYEPIMGSMLMKLVSQITRDHASYQGSQDEFWDKEFQPRGVMSDEESDPRQSFHALLIREMLQGVVQGKMIAQIDTPAFSGDTLADQRAEGGDQPYVMLHRRESLWDWRGDAQGLVYAKLHSYREMKDSWDGNLKRWHEFQIFQRTNEGIFTSIYTVENRIDQKAKDTDTLPAFDIKALEELGETNADIKVKESGGSLQENVRIFSTSGGAQRFPIVCRTIPKPLVIADQAYDLTRSHYNHVAGTAWALTQTNYGMPVFTGIEENSDFDPGAQKAGNGYYWALTGEQDVKWLVRPGDDISLSIEYQDQIKRKMLELIHKIAETASTEYAARMQSGESKKEQRRDLDILLEIYGQELREFAAAVLNVASIARDEDIEWTVEGFQDYNTSDLSEALNDYLALDNAGIDSDTLKKESRLAIANKAVARLNLSPSIMEAVTAEVEQDSPFTLADDEQATLTKLGELNLIAPEDLLTIFQKAGVIPADISVAQMLDNLGLVQGEPQTNNPVMAERNGGRDSNEQS